VELSPSDDVAIADASGTIADRDQLDAALRRLGPEERSIVVLHYYLDLTLPEAAKALGIPVGTAKSRLHRSLQALRVTVTSDDIVGAPELGKGRSA
jgi:RNA polymerase sigma factor (sigma-70 family)